MDVLSNTILLVSTGSKVRTRAEVLFRTVGGLRVPTLIFVGGVSRPNVRLRPLCARVGRGLTPGVLMVRSISVNEAIRLGDVSVFKDSFVSAVVRTSRTLARGCILSRPIGLSSVVDDERRDVGGKALLPVCRNDTLNGVNAGRLVSTLVGRFSPLPTLASMTPYTLICGVRRSSLLGGRACLQIFKKLLRAESMMAITSESRAVGVGGLRVPRSNKVTIIRRIRYKSVTVVPGRGKFGVNSAVNRMPRGCLPTRAIRPVVRTDVSPYSPSRHNSLLRTLSRLTRSSPLLRCELSSEDDSVIINFLKRIRVRIIYTLLRGHCRVPIRVKSLAAVCGRHPLGGTRCAIRVRIPPGPF